MTDKEKPWTIKSWDEFRQELAGMKPRSKLFITIKTELEARGHWKLAPRGPWKDNQKSK